MFSIVLINNIKQLGSNIKHLGSNIKHLGTIIKHLSNNMKHNFPTKRKFLLLKHTKKISFQRSQSNMETIKTIMISHI